MLMWLDTFSLSSIHYRGNLWLLDQLFNNHKKHNTTWYIWKYILKSNVTEYYINIRDSTYLGETRGNCITVVLDNDHVASKMANEQLTVDRRWRKFCPYLFIPSPRFNPKDVLIYGWKLPSVFNIKLAPNVIIDCHDIISIVALEFGALFTFSS